MEKQIYADRIFGVQNLPAERVKKAAWNTQGIKHRSQITLNSTAPSSQLRLEITTRFNFEVHQVTAWFQAGEQNFQVHAIQDGVSWSELDWGYLQHWEISVEFPKHAPKITYWIAAFDPVQDLWVYADNQAHTQKQATCFALVNPLPSMPEWAKQAILYQVFVDRFSPGIEQPWLQTEDVFGICGGTLQGVIDHLDHIQSLGCNTIWLSPIFVSDSHHGYNTKDLFTIEPRLGTLADFQHLLDCVHQRGMYLILDFVANHWSDQHPTFLAAQQEQTSAYFDWYRWKKWPLEYDCYFGVTDLPEINLHHGPARQHILDAATFWLKQGVDGYRLDHAGGPPLDFWADFYTTCQAANPDCWLFGEIPTTAPEQKRMSLVNHPPLDFLINHAFRETFAIETWTVGQMCAFLSGHYQYFANQYGPVFLDNHDMNRFLFACGNRVERLKQAAFLMFTLPNPPILYYGTEFGMTQTTPIHAKPTDFGTFEMARFPIDWQHPDKNMFFFFQQLFQLRKKWFVMWHGERKFETPNSGQNLLMESIRQETKFVTLAVNLGKEIQTIEVDSSQTQEYWGQAIFANGVWQLPPGGIAFWY